MKEPENPTVAEGPPASSPSPTAPPSASTAPAEPPQKTKRVVFEPTAMQERAIGLAEAIAQRVERDSEGLPTWRAPRLPQGSSEHIEMVLNRHLYAGTAGIAIFLAAAAEVSGESRFADLALEILAPVRHRLAKGEGEANLDPHAVIGGFHGYGSILYALARVGSALGRDDLLAEARKGIWIFSPEKIREDHHFDLMFGSAGLILALVAIAETSPSISVTTANDPNPIELAHEVADHLLGSRITAPSGHRVWSSSDDHPPLAGFSHGAAGIALALLRLHDHERQGVERSELAEAAEEALAYEATLFDVEHGNWPDVRTINELTGVPLSRWCHGAPGIALARLGHATTRDRPEVAIALETTLHKGWNGVDHLCCGIIGRAEILLTAAGDLERSEYRSQARRLLLQSLDRADREGSFRFVPRASGALFDPSFFMGAAGIGYSLLRFADESLPCIARLD